MLVVVDNVGQINHAFAAFVGLHMELGPRANDFIRRRRQLKIQVCTSPNGKAKALLKKAKEATASKSKKASGGKRLVSGGGANFHSEFRYIPLRPKATPVPLLLTV